MENPQIDNCKICKHCGKDILAAEALSLKSQIPRLYFMLFEFVQFCPRCFREAYIGNLLPSNPPLVRLIQ